MVLYAGSSADRAIIQQHEFYYDSTVSSKGSSSRGGSGDASRPVKFNALLVAYEMLLKEKTLLSRIQWAAAVFDEAHKLKGISSATRAAVKELNIDWMLLLTGQ